MKPEQTRRDSYGRVLAKSRRGRGREIVIETPAERLEDNRMAALGVAMVDDQDQTRDVTPTAGGAQGTGGEQTSGQEAGGDFPRALGGGWYELSNGETVRGQDDAVAAEARLQGEGEEG